MGERSFVAWAEPAAAPDRGGIMAFEGSTALQPPRQVSLVVPAARLGLIDRSVECRLQVIMLQPEILLRR